MIEIYIYIYIATLSFLIHSLACVAPREGIETAPRKGIETSDFIDSLTCPPTHPPPFSLKSMPYAKVGYKGKSCRIAHKISFPAGQPPPLQALGLQFTDSLVKYPSSTTFSTTLLPKKGKPRTTWLFRITQDLVTHFYKFTKICKRGHK